jgi:hypothetical protein
MNVISAMRAMLATLSIMAGAAWAQTALTPPQVGFMQDAANSVRPVYGIAGNFLPGNPVAGGVVSAAYSGSYGLFKTNSAIIVSDRAGSIVASNAEPDGPALFAFTRSGKPALVFIQAANTLLAWDGAAFNPVPFDSTTLSASAVVSIAAPHPGHAAMIVQRDDGLWDVRVRLATSEIDGQTAVPGVAPPVLMLASGELVYSDVNGIVLRKRDGSDRHISAQLPANFALQQMGDGWIQLRDQGSGQQFAIRITENREQYYQLPEGGQ